MATMKLLEPSRTTTKLLEPSGSVLASFLFSLDYATCHMVHCLISQQSQLTLNCQFFTVKPDGYPIVHIVLNMHLEYMYASFRIGKLHIKQLQEE